MSDVQQEPQAPKLGLLQQCMQKRDLFVQQSNQLSVQFQQLQGAIFACNEMIVQIENEAKEQMEKLAKEVKDNQGVNVDGEANSEQAEQVTQE